jgi:hypothetical protein
VLSGTYFPGGGGYTVYSDGSVVTDAQRRVEQYRYNWTPNRRLPTFQSPVKPRR